ncbi:hypothetical protein L1987_06926 [Smallanthus sonchifolius]|uniref:Uncharacterized protein n=1 Tax=Smallanthus sonchifolius TaxID=185202 RepID=A0ACB9JZV3_9ASTR|nr:hypothetical protein L1987_06926 [Smallanthus sonchifolius]
MILTANSFCVPPHLARPKSRSQVVVRSLSGGDPKPKVLFSESFRYLEDVENGRLSCQDLRKKRKEDLSENLEALWDDGYGTQSAEGFFKLAKDFSKPDGGPPQWFCPVSCGRPLKDSPLLLYLPGLDCLGLGLLLHEKALEKVFEVRCLHIPVQDRTPLEDLVQFVEETVRLEHASSPTKPIYLVGDSFVGV